MWGSPPPAGPRRSPGKPALQDHLSSVPKALYPPEFLGFHRVELRGLEPLTPTLPAGHYSQRIFRSRAVAGEPLTAGGRSRRLPVALWGPVGDQPKPAAPIFAAAVDDPGRPVGVAAITRDAVTPDRTAAGFAGLHLPVAVGGTGTAHAEPAPETVH